MTCTMSTELGGYLLGALTPTERAVVETHLATCSRCRDDVVSLAPLPGLLARIGVEDLDVLDAVAADVPEAGPPGSTPRTSDAESASGRSRPLRPQVLAVAAAAIGGLILAGVLVFGGSGGSDPPAPVATLTGTSDSTGVDASATLTTQAWGTGIRLRLDGLPATQNCALVVRADDGREETAGSWAANSYATLADIPGSTSIPAEDIAALDVVTADGQTLVHLTAPSTAPKGTPTS